MAIYEWEPDPAAAEQSNLHRFLAAHGLADLDALRQRAVAEPEWFYPAVLEGAIGIRWLRPYTRVLDLSRGKPWPRWFVDGQLNASDNALDRFAGTPLDDQPALIWEGEDGAVRVLTRAELRDAVARAAGGLAALGVRRGDRVGLFLPMLPETAIALLAAARLGAVAVPVFSGYAADAVATRLQAAGTRWLVTADGTYRRGRVVPLKETADEAAAAAPTVERVLVVSRLGREVPWYPDRDVRWEAVAAGPPQAPVPVGTDEPFLILYTSGTTGRPKGAVHSQAGFPLKAAIDMFFCFDVRPGDRVLWYTDIGWMMGPWLILGALALGATPVLYEGSPDHPGPDRLWSLVARHRVTHFGIAPTAIRALMAHGEEPVARHDRSSLRILGSTGEPWNPDPWRWYLHVVGEGRRPIINYSGGTEMSGGVVGCFPTLPLKPCCFHGPIPGMAADVLDEQGRPVRGEVGELVVREPWLGMTQGFWQEPERYLEAYWSRWPDVWVHGDWASIDADGYWFLHGRSDDTIKVAGKRVGPAEIESALAGHPAVLESAAVGVPDPVKGEVPVAFVVLRPGHEGSEALRRELMARVEERLGRALGLGDVCFVPDLPRTRNAKIMRRLVRAIALGRQELGDVTALENPAALEAVRAAWEARRGTRA